MHQMHHQNESESETVPITEKNNLLLKTEQNVKRPDTPYLFFSAITGTMLMVQFGSVFAWVSPAIVKLKTNDTLVNPLGRSVTDLEISMFLGFPLFFGTIGAFILPSLSDKIGRKKSLLGIASLMTVGIATLSFSKNVISMVTLLSILYFILGGPLGILPIYFTEICEVHNRSKYGCLLTGAFTLGQLFAYFVGSLFSLKYSTLILNAPLIPFFAFFFFAPESPDYLLSKGRKEECMKALKKLRSNKPNDEIVIDFKKLNKTTRVVEETNYFTIFKSKEGRRGMVRATIPVMLQYWSGTPTIMGLIGPIINDSGMAISGDSGAIIVGLFQFCCFLLTSLIIEKTGRKPMLLSSSLGSALSLVSLGLFYYLKYNNSPLIIHLRWMPIICVLLAVFFYSIGLGPVPKAIIGEHFPINVRSSGVSIALGISGLSVTLCGFMYPLLAAAFETHWCMWMFALICLGGFIYFYFSFPETEGKSIHEIQEMLKS